MGWAEEDLTMGAVVASFLEARPESQNLNPKAG
jgi:hypothetical protein